MRKLGLKCLAASAFVASSMYGFDYKISGAAMEFSKTGFNHSRINPLLGQYPTETFVNLTGKLEVDANITKGLRIGVGGVIGGQVYDSTKKMNYTQEYMDYLRSSGHLASAVMHPGGYGNGQIDQVGGGLGYEYMGEWNGMFPNQYYTLATPFNTHQGFIHRAFIEYVYQDIFRIIVGRYNSPYDWFYQLTQGATMEIKVHKDVKLYAFTSWGRGIADGQWLYDLYREKYYGVHKVGMLYNHTLKDGSGITLDVMTWFSPQTHTAPTIKFVYDTNADYQGSGFRSQTTLYAMYVYQWQNGKYGRFAPARYNTWDPYLDHGKWIGLQGPGGATFMLRQRFDINNYNFGFGFYANIGNPNPNIGTYGNPVNIYASEQWTDSIFSVGYAGINNITAADAFTGFARVGATYGQFYWDFATRFTTSPRTNAQVAALYLNYKFTKHITAGLKLEYFNSTVFQGYNPGSGFLGANGLVVNPNTGTSYEQKDKFTNSATGISYECESAANAGACWGISHKISQDRSHLMTHISYTF